jgi:flagellar hook-associated protein 1
LTHQHRLAVTANNIANVDTPGYSRKTVHLAPVRETPKSITETRTWSHGVGVTVTNVLRAHNAMLHNLLRQQKGDQAGHDTKAQALGTLESLMREDGDGSLGARLDAFWNAWYDLSNQADNLGFRSVVIQRGVELASHLQSLDQRIDSFEDQVLLGVPGNLTGVLAGDVQQFNQLTEELRALNAQISFDRGAYEPHALLDRRDQVLQIISEYANVGVDGDYNITLDGETIVSGDGSVRVELEIADVGPPPLFEAGGVPVNVSSGRIAAWVDVMGISESMRDRLNMLAVSLAEAVNAIHNSDLNPSGDTYDLNGQRVDWDFFTATSAADFRVNLLLYDPTNPMGTQPGLVGAAASRFDDGAGGVGPNRGDGARALQIAELAHATLAALNGQGFASFHTTGLTLLGGVVATERALADDGDAIIEAIKDQIQMETGVNLDEELMDMLLAQRAFQAAARLLQTVDEMMVTIIQR